MAYIKKDEIISALNDAGIEYDEDMTREELAELLPPVDDGPARDVPCAVLRDFWTEDGERIGKGRIAMFTAEEAMDGIEEGRLRRVKT